MSRRSLASLLVFLPAIAAAQTVTLTKPGDPPIVVNCSVAPGCVITVTPAVVDPPPPPPPPSCAFVVTPTTILLSAAGGASAVTVTRSASACTWAIGTVPAWVTPTTSPTGVSLAAAANTATTTRQTSVTIAGTVVTVTQAGSTTPPPPPPPGRVLARIDCTNDFPNCGTGYWGYDRANPGQINPFHTVTRVGNGARILMTRTSTVAQYYVGWQPTFSTTTSETNLWIRFRLLVASGFRGNGVNDTWTDKLGIVNNGGDPRAIIQLKPFNNSDNTDLGLTTTIGIGQPGPQGAPNVPLSFGVPHAIQIKVSRGTGITFAQYVDNPGCGTPTSVSQSMTFNPSTFSNVGLGFFSNMSVSSSGSVDLTITDAEIGTACDPNFR